jgi:glutathione S-transferase
LPVVICYYHTMTNKLYYYQATGRGHAIRLALAASNIEWEDEYPEGGYPPSAEAIELWRKIIPMLVMADGRVFTQSSAVLRAVARMGKIMPTDEEGLYTTDKLLADAEDLRGESYKAFVPWGATPEMVDAFINKVLPLHLGNLERQLKISTGDYFIGNSLTIADIACYDAVVNFGSNRVPDALDKFATLKAWVDKVESDEGIKKYLASESFAGVWKFGPDTLGK